MSGVKKFISLKDLKIAKIGRNTRALPCSQEFDAYLSSLGGKVPSRVAQALHLCIENYVNHITLLSIFDYCFRNLQRVKQVLHFS